MTGPLSYLPPEEPTRPQVSPRYQTWLTLTVMLALLTITLSAIVIILTNARERSLQEEFDLTLTAVWQSVQSAPATPAHTPTPLPPVVPGRYALATTIPAPAYSAAESCGIQVISGRILDSAGQPTDAYSLRIWGDYVRSRVVFTGEIAREAPGSWSLVLTDPINRRVWVQVIQEERTLSAPVEIVFAQDDCARNHAEVTFGEVPTGM